MLVLVDLFKFETVVAPELGVASSHRVGGFQQVVAEIAVAGLDHSGVFCLEVTELVSVPDKAGKLGDRGLGIETVDITDLSNHTGRVDLANAGDGGQGIGDDFKLLFNGLVHNLELFTNWLIQRDTIPQGWYCCGLWADDGTPNAKITLVDNTARHHAGEILSSIPLKRGGISFPPTPAKRPSPAWTGLDAGYMFFRR